MTLCISRTKCKTSCISFLCSFIFLLRKFLPLPVLCCSSLPLKWMTLLHWIIFDALWKTNQKACRSGWITSSSLTYENVFKVCFTHGPFKYQDIHMIRLSFFTIYLWYSDLLGGFVTDIKTLVGEEEKWHPQLLSYWHVTAPLEVFGTNLYNSDWNER